MLTTIYQHYLLFKHHVQSKKETCKNVIGKPKAFNCYLDKCCCICNEAATSSDGDSLKRLDDKSITTYNPHNKSGPIIAPSKPKQNIPPAIAKPVRYG